MFRISVRHTFSDLYQSAISTECPAQRRRGACHKLRFATLTSLSLFRPVLLHTRSVHPTPSLPLPVHPNNGRSLYWKRSKHGLARRASPRVCRPPSCDMTALSRRDQRPRPISHATPEQWCFIVTSLIVVYRCCVSVCLTVPFIVATILGTPCVFM